MNAVIGALVMLAGCVVILSVPDLSGGTIGGAVLFLVGLAVAQLPARTLHRHRDSTAAAVHAEAVRLTDA